MKPNWKLQNNALIKGQLISKANCQVVNSSKKRKNEFVLTTIRRVFVRFLEEIEDTKKTFRNYLTFRGEIFHIFRAWMTIGRIHNWNFRADHRIQQRISENSCQLSRLAHTNNQYESPILTNIFCLFTFWVYFYLNWRLLPCK